MISGLILITELLKEFSALNYFVDHLGPLNENFFKEWLCIIRNTECASTSMSFALVDRAAILLEGNTSLKHMRYATAKPLLPYLLPNELSANEFEFIGLVREAVDWFFSWYRQRPEIKHKPWQVQDITFEDFVGRELSHDEKQSVPIFF